MTGLTLTFVPLLAQTGRHNSACVFIYSYVTRLLNMIFENEWTDFDASWHQSSTGQGCETIIFGVKGQKSKSQEAKVNLDLDDITAVLLTQRLRWYGHVQCATSCINSITRLGLPGTRDRGRPRKTWSVCVRNDMTICNLDGVNPLDRNSWRTSVRRCQVLPTPESGTTAAP